MPPIDYKARCVFASGLTHQADDLLTVSPSAHPVHKLYPDLLCPYWVHYCFCVLLRQNTGHVLQFLPCREVSCSDCFFSCMSLTWPCRVFAGRHCEISEFSLYPHFRVGSLAAWVKGSPGTRWPGRRNRLIGFGIHTELYYYVCGGWE